ncbi:hypothetical protein JT27_18135 [Alcaligenes faecalis]|uniref:hypothetical protein n=1 Tax=Alcaligenes faecalis TaxID=511 RepID=UPI00052E00BB|nr:hypothetical protein [Alcaligenes faecalis]KGP00253.1 hypothetical protein JT27_18135 [Alcaligenes faecalis]
MQAADDYRGFTMMRVYVGGPRHGDREVDTRNLTWGQTRDETLFPLGMHKDKDGNDFVYSPVANFSLEKV